MTPHRQMNAQRSAAELAEQEQTRNLWHGFAVDVLLKDFAYLKEKATRLPLPLIEVELLGYTEQFPFELRCRAAYAEQTCEEEKLGKYKARYTKDFTITCYPNQAGADNHATQEEAHRPRIAQGCWESGTGNELHYVVLPSPKKLVPEDRHQLTGYDRQMLIEAAFHDARLERKSMEIGRYLKALRAGSEYPEMYQTSDLYTPNVPINISGRSGKYTFLVQPAVMNAYNCDLDGKLSVLGAPPALIVQLGQMKDFDRACHASTMQRMLRQKNIDIPHMLQEPTELPGTGYFYSFQEVAPGKHTDLDLHHLATLGRMLGKIHALASEDVARPPVSNVLPPKATADSVLDAIEDTKQRERDGTTIESLEDMIRSGRHEMAGSATPEQIGEIPGLYAVLQCDEAEARQLRDDMRKSKNFPSGYCHGDPNPKNTLVFPGPTGRVMLIDCELTGEGYFIDEIAQTLYFRCVNERGELDPERTNTFLAPYIEERAKGSQPLTQKEIAALPEHIKNLAERQAQPIWEMYRNEPEDSYRQFARRHKVLPEQMAAYMRPEKADLFSKTFLGRPIREYEQYENESFPPSNGWQARVGQGMRGRER